MTLLDSLNFVKGAVSKKDFLPIMTHFCINNGSVQAYNGIIALNSPIDLDFRCNPKADKLIKAVNSCDSSISMFLLSPAELQIKSGRFKVVIDCLESDYAETKPSGHSLNVDFEALLEGFRSLSGFIGNDASRPWSNGILMDGSSLFGTNNIIAAEYWVGSPMPKICIPEVAINELLRIKKPITEILIDDKSISFIFEDSWMKSQLLDSSGWPDVRRLLDKESVLSEIHSDLFESLEKIKPFLSVTSSVVLNNGCISSDTLENKKACTIELDWLQCNGLMFNAEFLVKLKGLVNKFDFSSDRTNCFSGNRLRGIIIQVLKV